MNLNGKYETGWRRFFAAFIDAVIVNIVAIPIQILFKIEIENHVFWISDPIQLFNLILLTYFMGATIGKKILGLKVVDITTESSISLLQSVLREIGSVIVFLIQLGLLWQSTRYKQIDITDDYSKPFGILNLGIFVWFTIEMTTMLLNKKRRALHDLIAGTVVLRKKYMELEKEIMKGEQS